MTEFKQIIGRGTRVRDDYGKLWFNIIDYTGSATQRFARLFQSAHAIGYAEFRSHSCNAVIRVYDDAGNVIETDEHAGRVRGVVNEAPSQLGRFCRQWISYGSLKNNSS
jgi:hypothetical protein